MSDTGTNRALTWRGISLPRILRGAATCVALWCVLYAPRLLPSYVADKRGLWIACALGIALALTRFDRFLPAILIAASACLVLVANTPIADALAHWWIREDLMPAAGVQAIVPLSGNVNNEGTINAEALDHLITAFELVKAGKSAIISTTVVEGSSPAGYFTSVADQARLIGLFTQHVEWLHTPIVYTTREEATASAALLMPRGIRHIAVVASPMHTRRACATFEAVGFNVVCVASRTSVPGGRNPSDWPRDRLSAFGDWVYEAVAMLEYRARGWVHAQPSAR